MTTPRIPVSESEHIKAEHKISFRQPCESSKNFTSQLLVGGPAVSTQMAGTGTSPNLGSRNEHWRYSMLLSVSCNRFR